MSSSPECLYCGDYVHYGHVLCKKDLLKLLQWIDKLYTDGFTDEIIESGMGWYRFSLHRIKELEGE